MMVSKQEKNAVFFFGVLREVVAYLAEGFDTIGRKGFDTIGEEVIGAGRIGVERFCSLLCGQIRTYLFKEGNV